MAQKKTARIPRFLSGAGSKSGGPRKGLDVRTDYFRGRPAGRAAANGAEVFRVGEFWIGTGRALAAVVAQPEEEEESQRGGWKLERGRQGKRLLAGSVICWHEHGEAVVRGGRQRNGRALCSSLVFSFFSRAPGEICCVLSCLQNEKKRC